MNIVAIIQARIGSTRLPGKVLLNLCGKTVLEHVVQRVKSCKLVKTTIVATTILTADDTIVKECKNIGAKWFRGSSEDVLSRYYLAAKENNADIIIRVTSDCPLFDGAILHSMLEEFCNRLSTNEPLEYMSNTLEKTFPRGMDCEILTMSCLERTHKEAQQNYEKEHVTPYIYNNPDKFHIASFKADEDNSLYRLTLDTQEDWELNSKIYDMLYEDGKIFTYTKTIDFLKKHPELAKINAHVEQKKLGE
jgi:spore coat polysaccharide biosynthesis protein SpsF